MGSVDMKRLTTTEAPVKMGEAATPGEKAGLGMALKPWRRLGQGPRTVRQKGKRRVALWSSDGTRLRRIIILSAMRWMDGSMAGKAIVRDGPG